MILLKLCLLVMWSGITNTQSPGESACSVFHVLTQPIYKSTISLLWGGKPGGMPACSVLYTDSTLWLHSPHWIHSAPTGEIGRPHNLWLIFYASLCINHDYYLDGWLVGLPCLLLEMCLTSLSLNFPVTCRGGESKKEKNQLLLTESCFLHLEQRRTLRMADIGRQVYSVHQYVIPIASLNRNTSSMFWGS